MLVIVINQITCYYFIFGNEQIQCNYESKKEIYGVENHGS